MLGDMHLRADSRFDMTREWISVRRWSPDIRGDMMGSVDFVSRAQERSDVCLKEWVIRMRGIQLLLMGTDKIVVIPMTRDLEAVSDKLQY